MAASVEYRQEEMSSGGTEKEKCDDLSLFVDFSGVNLNLDLLQKSDQIQVTFDSASVNPLKPETKSIIHGQNSGADDLLNTLNNITDYDWLLSPPHHPLSSPEIEEQITLNDHTVISNGHSTSPESKLENPLADGLKRSTTIRRPSPSRKAPSTGSRSATPTTRPTITKPSRSSTPTSRATVTAATKPVAPLKRSTTPTPRPPVLAATSKSTSRSSTPFQRPTIHPVASKPTSSSRSSTPVQRPSVTVSAKSASRSSTPVQRPSVTASAKSASRSSTPVQRASVTASVKSASRSSTPTQRPSVTVSAKSASRSSTPTQRSSVTASAKLASRSSTPTLRPSSASGSAPDKSRPSNGGVKPGMTRVRGDDDVNPVLMGTQMVERVVNMRKLAPPRQDRISDQDHASGKLSVSQDNPGFGRSLSKKSFDMALRHLDIRRSMPGNMRASITKVPASSVYSVRPESTKPRTMSASDSPLATSSSVSSDHSEPVRSYR